MLDPALLLRETSRWSALLGGVATAITWIAWSGGIALGVALGAALGCLNLWLLARALHQSVAQAEHYRGRKWALPAALLLKWPLVLLLIAGLALYTPARAEGLAIGFALSLVAAMLAALRSQSKTPPSGTTT